MGGVVLREVSQSSTSGKSVLAVNIDHVAFQMITKDSRVFIAPMIHVFLDDSMVAVASENHPTVTSKIFL